MKLTPEIERKKLRLPDYDYTTAGFYYVTLCTQSRLCLFGEISEGKMMLNDFGKILHDALLLLPNRYSNVELDTFVIMPNHLHAIICLFDGTGTTQRSSPTSISEIIKNFKTYTTRLYIEGVHKYNWPTFEKKLWQRSFYEHVIRNDQSLCKIQQYIVNNPLKWELDRENPLNIKN